MNGYQSLSEVLKVNSRLEDRDITIIEGKNRERMISYKRLYKKSLEVLGCLQFKGISRGQELIL